MSTIGHDFINILAPAIDDADRIEKIYLDIERIFSNILSSKLAHPICEKIPRNLTSRVSLIQSRLRTKTKRYLALGDESLNVYFSFGYRKYPLGTTGINCCEMLLGIKRDLPSISIDDLVSIISIICENANSYWALFMPGDDYYQIANLIQRKRYINEEGNLYESLRIQIHDLLYKYPEFDRLPNIDVNGFFYRVDDIHVVPEIRWLNYWNKDICKFNSFPNMENDFDNSVDFVETNSGYIWSLTSESWKMSNASHRQHLLLAYERFPKIGVKINL